jgi:hypothetical protein
MNNYSARIFFKQTFANDVAAIKTEKMMSVFLSLSFLKTLGFSFSTDSLEDFCLISATCLPPSCHSYILKRKNIVSTQKLFFIYVYLRQIYPKGGINCNEMLVMIMFKDS